MGAIGPGVPSVLVPLAGVLQSIALYAATHKLFLRIAHVAGERNAWADALSRGPAVDAEFWNHLDASKRLRPDWRALLNLSVDLIAKHST